MLKLTQFNFHRYEMINLCHQLLVAQVQGTSCVNNENVKSKRDQVYHS